MTLFEPSPQRNGGGPFSCALVGRAPHAALSQPGSKTACGARPTGPPTDRRINMAGMVDDKDKRKTFMHSGCNEARGAGTRENRERIANSSEESSFMSGFV